MDPQSLVLCGAPKLEREAEVREERDAGCELPNQHHMKRATLLVEPVVLLTINSTSAKALPLAMAM